MGVCESGVWKEKREDSVVGVCGSVVWMKKREDNCGLRVHEEGIVVGCCGSVGVCCANEKEAGQ